MEVLPDDLTLGAVIGSELGIDNAVFDLNQLQEYITDDLCLPEETIPAIAYSDGRPHNVMDNGYKLNNMRMMNTVQQVPMSQTPTSIYDCRVQGSSMPAYHDNPLMNPTLPDSPPDSEPYSPSDRNQRHASQENKYSVGLPPHSVPQHMYSQHHRAPGMATSYGDPASLNHLPTTQPQASPATTMPHTNASINHQILTQAHLGSNIPVQQNKKRKFTDSPNNTVTNGIFNGRNNLLNIKQEPLPGSNFPSYLPDVCDDDFSYDPDSSSNGFVDGQYQVIKWQPFQKNTWCSLTDADLKELALPHYQVDADKGFNFYTSDNAFVCQKKNHFQVTVHIGMSGNAKYVRLPEGMKKIDSFNLHFHGIKYESPSQNIKIEQSQSDRSKKPFHPVQVDLVHDQVNKLTIGRLHFSETTSNNMRKKGRPNPDQRYFQLVVSLYAHCGENKYLVCGSESERIIVRASNPGQFDSDVEAVWSKSQNGDAVHHGKVGINTDHPEEALTVHGNIRVTGHIVHPSDKRIKRDLKEVDPKDQLKNVTQMKVYNYGIHPDFAKIVGLSESQKNDTGLIAQDVQKLLPDAVIETGDITLPDGNTIEKLLVVNKDRIFMENLGAVKELCKLTDNLEVRIDELEKMNTKLRKLNHFDSFKSTASSKSNCSSFSAASTTVPKKATHNAHHHHHHSHRHKCPPVTPQAEKGWCSNKFIQITIIALILIMAFCLIAITVLYILERQKESEQKPATHQSVVDSSQKKKQPSVIWNQDTSSLLSTIFPSSVSKAGPKRGEHEEQATSPPTTGISVKRPVTGHALFDPYPPCVPQMCEAHCCSTPREDEPIWINVWAGYRGGPEYTNQISTGENPAAGDTSEVNNNIPDKDQQTQPGLNHVIIDGGSEPSVYSDSDDQNLYTEYRTKRDGNTHIQIVIKELNFTLGPGHCNSSIHSPCDYSNYTYHIGLHPYFGWEPITVQFRVTSPLVVYMCNNLTYYQFLCSDRIAMEGESAGEPKQMATEWRLAVGQHFQSFYKFRLSNMSNEDNQYNEVCSSSRTRKDGLFLEEYNLHFYRICSDFPTQ